MIKGSAISGSITITQRAWIASFLAFGSPNQFKPAFIKRPLTMTVKNAAAILAHLHQTQVDLGVKHIESHDAQIAREILDRLYSFEDLVFLSGLDMQTLLLKISDKSLVICLKKVSKPLGIKILSAMTKARARGIGEDLQNSEKLKSSEIDAVQLEVLKVAYELHQTQKITLRKKALDEKYL